MSAETEIKLKQTPFIEFPKIGRYSRECIVTEKIDGTNGQILIDESGNILVGSRTRWITEADDNFGFCRWVMGNKDTILKLGVGRHFGEWWGQGIQRNYGLKEKRFSLFNVARWCLHSQTPARIQTGDPRIEKFQSVLPEGLGLVPELWRGPFDFVPHPEILRNLTLAGSKAAPGFMKPEGIVIWHAQANVGFKKTIENDDEPKSLRK